MLEGKEKVELLVKEEDLENLKESLDIGCGHDPKGTVNIDLFVKATKHRSGNQNELEDTALVYQDISNLIRADACHLPFRSNCFQKVFSRQTIEHVPTPALMVKEMVRVCAPHGRIYLNFPGRFSSRRHRNLHVSFLTQKWCQQTFQSLGLKSIWGEVAGWRYIPHVFFGVFKVPSEINVYAIKN